MGAGTYGRNLRSLVLENWAIIFPAVGGFVFLCAAILLLRKGDLLFGLVFFLCALFLFYVSRHHYRKKGTPEYGKTITFEPWEATPAWKKWGLYAFIILFLLFWGYLVVTAIMSGDVHLENICIGDCGG
jgi:hypothetical protein